MYDFMFFTFIPSLKMVFEWIKEMFVSFSDKMQEGNTVSVVFMFSVLGTVISGLFYILMNFIEHSINIDYSEPFIPLGTRFRGDSKTHNFRHAHYKSVNGKRFYYDTSSGNVSYFDEDSYQVMFDSDNPFSFKVHGKTIHDLPLNHKRFKKKFGDSSHYVINTDSGFYLVPKGNSRQARRYRRRISKLVGSDLNDNDFT